MRFDCIPLDLLHCCREQLESGCASPVEFDRLCELIQPDLYSFLYALLRNNDDTDEALVECLLRVYRYLPRLQDLGKFPGWIMKMAVNQANSVRAQRAAKGMESLDDGREIHDDALVATAQRMPSPREAASGKEMQAEIEQAVAKLPERQRHAIVLYEVEQLSIAEVAQCLGCSEGAVKFHLHEGRRKLRQWLSHLMQKPLETGAVE